jgi:hypothetical protein
MIAASHGALWNASDIGRSLGMSYHTANHHLDFLEGAYLVRRLAPFHGNLRKRLVKSPKVYWRDTGLLHSLMGVATYEELLSKPWVGASWEGFVIGQTLDYLGSQGRTFESNFFRTNDGYEADLVLEASGKRWAIEIKLTSSPGPSDMARLDKVADLIHAEKRILVSRTSREMRSKNTVSTHLVGWMELLKTEFG